MSTRPFDQLPAESRAVLSLVLVQSRSYADIARLLHIDEGDVRRRAHRAAAALVTCGERPGDADEARIVDYLLGEQTVSERAATRAVMLSASHACAWARRLRSELAPLAARPLPAIPDAPSTEPPQAMPVVDTTTVPPEPTRPEPSEPDQAASAPASEPAPAAVPGAAPEVRRARGPLAWPMRYRIGLLVAVGVVFLVIARLNSGGSSPPTSRHGTVEKLELLPVGGNPAAAGSGTVERQNGGLLLLLGAHGLAPNRRDAYAVWLFNSPRDARLLGYVSPAVGRSGTFSSSVTLPADAQRFRSLVVTVERSAQPTRPGQILLRATLMLP